MTARQFYDFAVGQIAWYERQNEFCKRQISRCNDWLKRERANDKELAQFALNDRPEDPITVQVFGGKYVGSETRKLINERAKYYREIKYNNKMIAHYEHERASWERYIG